MSYLILEWPRPTCQARQVKTFDEELWLLQEKTYILQVRCGPYSLQVRCRPMKKTNKRNKIMDDMTFNLPLLKLLDRQSKNVYKE